MFDLWGQTVPTPLPSVELSVAEVTAREKSAWEKELLGVSLSKPLFSSKKLGTMLCGEIDLGMDGQAVVVVGEVAGAIPLLTRDHRPFVKVAFEDISGQVEVIVWPNVYEKTRDLWQEGNTLQLEGKVKLRDERVQLNCNRVQVYQAEKASVETVVVAETAPTTVEMTVEKRRLVISLAETGNEGGDVARFRQVIGVLKDFPGGDEVGLCVNSEGEVVNLKLTNITTDYCLVLHQRLAELVGEEGLRVEKVDTAHRKS